MNGKRHHHRTVVRRRQMLMCAVFGFGIVLAACGGGSSVDLSPVATKVQVATNGFSFPNFPATAYKDEFDASDVTNMFGSGAAVCASGRGESCTLTAEAAAFARMVNQSRASGHCEGLAAVALSRFDSSANPPTVKLPDQNETIHTIMRAFATQFIPEAQADVEKWLNKSLDEKLGALVESFKKGKLDFTLGLYVAEGGHALLPYAVEFPTKDTARIMVYDTNWPGKNRYVDVDLKAKKWRFSFSGEDPANDPNEWTGGPADMDLTSFESRSGSCPFCGDGTKASSTTMLVRTTNLDWSVEAEGQTLKPGGIVTPGSGVIVKPVKGLNIPAAGGLFSAAQERSAYDYLIRIPNAPTKAGKAKARTKLKFSGTTSLFAVTPTGIAQVNTPGNPDIPVEVGESSIVSKDPAVQLTLASGNLVATASGPNAVLETSSSGTVEVTVTTASGQVVRQEVTPESPAAKVTADANGGVTALVAAASGEVVKREVSSTGVETKTVTTESLDLNATTFKAPPGLESKPIEALPALDKRNLANPEYKADAPYVAPTTTTSVAVKNKALEPAKTVLSKFAIEPAVFGDAAFTVTEPSSNSNANFTYSSSEPSVATVNASTGKVTIVGAGTTTITATQEALPLFTSGTISAQLKVAKAPTKLGALTIPKKSFGDEPFAIKEPTTNSTADFTYSSSEPSVATVNASTGKVTIVGAGTTNITASQAATANYEASSTKATLTVAKSSLTFASSVLEDLTFGASDFSLTPPATAGTRSMSFSSTTPEVASVDATTGRVRLVGAGAASLRINFAASNNFEATTQTVSFNVKRARPTLTMATQADKPYGASDFALAVPTTNSNGTISYASKTPSVATVNATTGTVHLVGTGTAVIEVSVAATNNYDSASNTVTFVALKAVPTYGPFSLNSMVATSRAVQIVPPTSNSSSPLVYSSSNTGVATVNSSTGAISAVSAGTTTITVSQVSNALFEAGSTSASLTVTRATPVVGAFAIAAKTYGDAPFALAAPASSSTGAFSYSSSDTSVATVAPDGTVTVVGAGISVITATQAQTGVYNSTYAVGTLAVAKATPTYGAFSFADREVGVASFSVSTPSSTSSAAFTYTSSVPSVATIDTSGNITVITPGTTIITASQAATANYTASSISAPLTVMQPVPTLGAFNAAANTSSPGLMGVRYNGYFNDNVNWFATAPLHGDTNIISDFTNFTSNADQYSWQWSGAFKAPTTGAYHFCTISDDASYMWLGSNALAGFTTTNALVRNGGAHGMAERCGDINLTANTSYPVLVDFGEAGGGDAIQIYFTIDGGNRIYNGTGYYYSMQPSRVGDPNYTVTHPVTNSSGAFTYTSSNPSVATINSVTGEVSILSAGTSTFTATQAASGSYRSASVTNTVTFEKGVQVGLSAVPATCALGGTCAVGDIGPGGGTVVYAPGTTFTSDAACGTNCQYLEIAPVNWNGASSDANNQFTWDCSGTSLNSTSATIGGGYANTTAMATNCMQVNAIASRVRSTTYGDLNDWYIPSLAETAQIYAQRSVVPGYQSSGSYWSSTEVSGTNAYRQNGASTASTVKTSAGTVRPIRAFKAMNLNMPFKVLSVPLVASGGNGTGGLSIQLTDTGSASCSLANNVVTAQMSGTCKIKVARVGDANWNDGLSADFAVSFYGPAMSTVTGGYYSTCGVNVQGGASCWGYGDWGLLGDGRRTETHEPVTVSGLTSGVASLAAGQHHNCALMTDGTIKCWGYGDNGQLGTGGGGQYNSPVDASALNFKAVKIVAGYQHTCALTRAGGVMCWGLNGWGQLGDGTATTRYTPVEPLGLSTGVVDLSAGYGTTCALLENHSVKCWGFNEHGQIGDGTHTNRSVPTLVPGLNNNVKSVVNGTYNTCVITNTSTLMCWGNNGWGQLGIGNTSDSNSPVAVPNMSNIAKISLGEADACSLDSNGVVKCWGRNNYGQLGDGTVVDHRSTPVTVLGITGRVTDISAGMNQHTCAVIAGGTVKCWGQNPQGQLGDGTSTSRSTPVDVLRMRGAEQITTTLGALTLPNGVIDVNTAPFTIATPSASRAGTITFESSDPSVATVNAVTGQVTIVAAGHTSISATIGGTGNYTVGVSRVQLYVRPSNPQNLTDCQLGLTCNVGDIGPAGGRVFFVDTQDQYPGIDYLEAAPTDATPSAWCSGTGWDNYTYGPQNTDIGMYNMQTILGNCATSAAKTAVTTSINSYSDWYLPTTSEMQNMVTAFASTSAGNGFTPLVANSKYWTSFEASGSSARLISTSNSALTDASKSETWKIRPVRAFISLYTSKIQTALHGYDIGTSGTEYTHATWEISRPYSLSGAVITFTSSDSNIASANTYFGRITNNGVGSVTFTATQGTWAGFTGSTQSVSYSVSPSAPTVGSFDPPNGVLKTSSAPFTLAAPTSQNPASFTFSSSNTNVATVNAATGQVTITGAGQTMITVSQAASNPWTAASKTVLLNVAKSCADGGACVLGDTGPGGGKIYFAASTKQSWGRYLEAAPADIASAAWCDVSQDTPGARATLVGNGQANTNAVVASCSSGAAIAADNYTVNGKSDWYLPGFDELEEMYRARAYVAGLASGTYWSSTEDNSSAAKRFDFAAGVYVSGTKAASNAVRPIRSVDGPPDGLTAATAGISATQLMVDNGYTGTGNYFIKPQGYQGAAEQLWCDFTHLGGGWALIGKGRHSNDYNGGWFGTESAIDTSGLLQANAKNAGVSKVSSEFVNYLMNGSANGWTNVNPNNYLVLNRINDANDGYGGVSDSWKMKVKNDTQFKWINQLGSTPMNGQNSNGTGQLQRWDQNWLSGNQTYNWDDIRYNDAGENDARRLFTWHWDGHGAYHGWSAGQSIGNGQGFMAGGEGHAIQFVQLWAR